MTCSNASTNPVTQLLLEGIHVLECILTYDWLRGHVRFIEGELHELHPILYYPTRTIWSLVVCMH